MGHPICLTLPHAVLSGHILVRGVRVALTLTCRAGVLGLDDPRMERVIGNDPTSQRWQRGVIPLYDTRRNLVGTGISYLTLNRKDRVRRFPHMLPFAVADPHWQRRCSQRLQFNAVCEKMGL